MAGASFVGPCAALRGQQTVCRDSFRLVLCLSPQVPALSEGLVSPSTPPPISLPFSSSFLISMSLESLPPSLCLTVWPLVPTLQAEAGRVALELSMTKLRAEEASLRDALSKLSALNEGLAQDKLALNRLVAQVRRGPAGPPASPPSPAPQRPHGGIPRPSPPLLGHLHPSVLFCLLTPSVSSLVVWQKRRSAGPASPPQWSDGLWPCTWPSGTSPPRRWG